MSAVIEEIDDSYFDAEKAFGDVLTHTFSGDIDKYLQATFDFLNNKTNFFKDPNAEKRIHKILSQFMTLKSKTGFKGGFFGSSKTQTQSKENKPTVGNGATQQPTKKDEMESVKAPPPPQEEKKEDIPEAEEKEDDENDESKGIKPNIGNGADYENYSWTQTLSEITMQVPVPEGTRGKDLTVQIDKDKLKVGVKGKEPVVDGELFKSVHAEECLWNLVDKRIVEVQNFREY
eukprot:TRINITY_DN7686_c0_g1_i1.p1 TRINITY_DN7686_c0_g1~~TRINITY_DN7686_c0_g1_i1.p1  ORF type:complete len:232 (+),score=48.39 TRINITY_DN7686_c0_g1_i1:236-931(+)